MDRNEDVNPTQRYDATIAIFEGDQRDRVQGGFFICGGGGGCCSVGMLIEVLSFCWCSFGIGFVRILSRRSLFFVLL